MKKKERSSFSFFKISENKQYHVKDLLSSFNMNGHALEFFLETKKIEPLCKA